jgi:hypothetical protein
LIHDPQRVDPRGDLGSVETYATAYLQVGNSPLEHQAAYVPGTDVEELGNSFDVE